MSKFVRVLCAELAVLHFWLILSRILAAPLPPYFGGRLRAQALRMAGFRIGRNTLVWGMPAIVGTGDLSQRLSIGENSLVSPGCHFDLAAEIRLGDRVSLGPQVMFITGNHEIGGPWNRLGKLTPKSIRVGSGVWFGARATVLPGVSIGDGVVIGAGTLVRGDVPAHTVVIGVPGRVIRHL